ncbi:DNA-3-methyladenine glycosylase family protein [Paenibacillus urinalis]|uniref:DNA-3-methyladenine glycosylase II n=1 Tax=Paenibacillus urinalis TaxID=521520 RepID=A0AAX3N1F1_9BACL|nr:DNA-3-methyladenine glycosylase [Paenibacillus urinalis]WDH82545.1 DNA-3-methyladenine glycosylase [Paenibacillus urinalis]
MDIPQQDMPGSNSKVEFYPGDIRFKLSLPELFNYEEILYYLNRSKLECLHQVDQGRIYKLIRVKEAETMLPFQLEYDQEAHALNVQSLLETPLLAEECQAAAAYITEWLDLDRDLTPVETLVASDPILSKFPESLRGLRIVGVPDLFEALCWAVLGQQINLTFAYTLKRRLTETYGEQHQYGERTYHLFPTPQSMLTASVQDLKELQITTKKSEYILDLARRISSGELQKGGLIASGYYEAEQTLISIRGIGPWTAHYVLMRCLRDPAAFPIGDAGLHAALKRQLGLSVKPTPDQIRELFKPWAGYEAYAVFYLWRTLTL